MMNLVYVPTYSYIRLQLERIVENCFPDPGLYYTVVTFKDGTTRKTE